MQKNHLVPKTVLCGLHLVFQYRQNTKSEPSAVGPILTMVHRARLELAHPGGHQFLRMARLPFRHPCIVVRVFITDSENQDQTLAAEQAYSKPISTFRTFDFHSDAGYNGITTTKEVPNMTKVKRLTLDRYEHGLMVRALYEE